MNKNEKKEKNVNAGSITEPNRMKMVIGIVVFVLILVAMVVIIAVFAKDDSSIAPTSDQEALIVKSWQENTALLNNEYTITEDAVSATPVTVIFTDWEWIKSTPNFNDKSITTKDSIDFYWDNDDNSISVYLNIVTVEDSTSKAVTVLSICYSNGNAKLSMSMDGSTAGKVTMGVVGSTTTKLPNFSNSTISEWTNPEKLYSNGKNPNILTYLTKNFKGKDSSGKASEIDFKSSQIEVPATSKGYATVLRDYVWNNIVDKKDKRIWYTDKDHTTETTITATHVDYIPAADTDNAYYECTIRSDSDKVSTGKLLLSVADSQKLVNLSQYGIAYNVLSNWSAIGYYPGSIKK